MTELFLVMWLGIANCTAPIDGYCLNGFEIQSQTVSSEEELNTLYQQHEDDGVKVFKFVPESGECIRWYDGCNYCDANGCTLADCEGNYGRSECVKKEKSQEITELQFKEQPCGKWVEK